jgi:hypothetical protein
MGRGRKKIEKVPIDCNILDEALKKNKLSINILTNDKKAYYIDVTRRTISRARHDGYINPKILDKIGEQLNVDPYWLTGQALNVFPSMKKNSEYCKIENHPYNKNAQQLKKINLSRYFQELLILHGVSFEQFNSLSEATQHGFKMEIDLVIRMVIFKYFSSHTKPDDVFLTNEDLHKMSCDVLSGETYEKLFELIES